MAADLQRIPGADKGLQTEPIEQPDAKATQHQAVVRGADYPRVNSVIKIGLMAQKAEQVCSET